MKPTPAQALVERLFFDRSELVSIATQATSIRIPEDLLAYAQVLGERAGTTRSAMLNNCMRLGLDILLAELPESIRAKVEGDIVDRFSGASEEVSESGFSAQTLAELAEFEADPVRVAAAKARASKGGV